MRQRAHNYTRRRVDIQNSTSGDWGHNGSGGLDYEYHMFASTFVNGCNVWEWTSNSIITHAVSKSPLGPYEQREITRIRIYASPWAEVGRPQPKNLPAGCSTTRMKSDSAFDGNEQATARWRPACRKRMKVLSRLHRPASTYSSLPLDRLDLVAARRWMAVVSVTVLLMPRSTEPARLNAKRRLVVLLVIGIALQRWQPLCPTHRLASRRGRGRHRCEYRQQIAKIPPSMAPTTGERNEWARAPLF